MGIDRAPAPFTIESLPGAWRAIVPARRHGLVILFLCVWLAGWLYGVVLFARYLLAPSAAPLDAAGAAWLAGWAIGGAFAVLALGWQLGGQEVVTIDAVTLAYRAEMLGLAWSRQFTKVEVKHLRLQPVPAAPGFRRPPTLPPLPPLGVGPIAFEHRSRTFRFAHSLEEAAARRLMDEVALQLARDAPEA